MKTQPKDIESMEKRIRQMKSHQQKANSSEGAAKKHDTIANAFRIGTEFVAAVFVGMCIGYMLDKIFGTKVIFILVFSLFGCMAGILNVYRTAKEIDKSIQKEKN